MRISGLEPMTIDKNLGFVNVRLTLAPTLTPALTLTLTLYLKLTRTRTRTLTRTAVRLYAGLDAASMRAEAARFLKGAGMTCAR